MTRLVTRGMTHGQTVGERQPLTGKLPAGLTSRLPLSPGAGPRYSGCSRDGARAGGRRMSGAGRSGDRIGGLVAASGPDAGLIIPLGEGPAVVGRESGCEARFVDPSISRRHFQLSPEADGSWTIKDLRSSNGTFMDGERITRRTITAGDEITVGETHLRVLSEDEVQGTLRRRTGKVTERDPVAQVCTKALFEMRLRTEVALANRTGAFLSVALVEVDHVPTLESHEPGFRTRILPAVALKLSGLLRENDLLGFLGDETFAALITDPHPLLAYVTAERMCTATQTLTVEVAGRPVPVTSSVGLATDKGRRDLTVDELLARARGQLTLACEAGGNCVSRWVHVSARDRLPARSTDLLPTELDQARKTKILRSVSLPSGPTTIPPPPPRRTPQDDDDLL